MMDMEESNALTSFTKEEIDEMLTKKEKYIKLIEKIENEERNIFEVFEDNDVESALISKEKKKKKLSAKKLKEIKAENKKNRTRNLKKAQNYYLAGKFSSVRKAADHHNVSYTTLHNGLVSGEDNYSGSGRFSKIITVDEETKNCRYGEVEGGYWLWN